MKKCGACEVQKPLADFPPNKNNKDGLNTKCRACFNAYMKEWYAKNKEKHKERVAANRNPARERARRYGLTTEQVDDMLGLHDGMCHICKTRPATCIDHCHKTGNVRGILCGVCNTGLGQLGDNIEGLQKAIEYLRHSSTG